MIKRIICWESKIEISTTSKRRRRSRWVEFAPLSLILFLFVIHRRDVHNFVNWEDIHPSTSCKQVNKSLASHCVGDKLTKSVNSFVCRLKNGLRFTQISNSLWTHKHTPKMEFNAVTFKIETAHEIRLVEEKFVLYSFKKCGYLIFSLIFVRRS